MDYNVEIANGASYAFIDKDCIVSEQYKPRLLVNDYQQGEKVLSSIIAELSKCDEFYFSVAFVTNSGVSVLSDILKELEQKGIKGKIVASQYQNFTDPKALQRLLALQNVDLRILTEEEGALHSKGYIFRRGGEYSIIVGSSNLTQAALCLNKEWNLKVISSANGNLVKESLFEFEGIYQRATPVTLEWIEEYTKIYKDEKRYKDIAIQRVGHIGRISPNKMQVAALSSLERLRKSGESKALLISATGTGKTYLAAFDALKAGAKKFLFIVHRETIAKSAQRSFRRIFGPELKTAILSGNSKDFDADFIFSTIQTLSKDDVLQKFAPDEFDYIVFDEVHRAGASTYQKVNNYFQPKFLLGMSATPERNDEFDIFAMFDHNVAYEIRLKQAMEENMICPFHYFGVSEMSVNGEVIKDETDFKYLTNEERIKHIVSKIQYYGYDGERVKGLIFTSRKEEAKWLSDQLNTNGFRTIALTGEDSQDTREYAIARLEADQGDNLLDYIVTVDVFNEGVDIPSINQIVMLRPTQSAIIFVQQLGRGLRRIPNKEYVVVIDFIGNYKNNYLIPIALSGDYSYNKDTIRRYILEGSRIIPGCSTISFDRITKERIFKALDQAKFQDVQLLKKAYTDLKIRLGRIPTMEDFYNHGTIDILRFIDKFGSYYNYLKRYEKEYTVELTDLQKEFLEYISVKFANGKRIHEAVFLSTLLANKKNLMESFTSTLNAEYGISPSENTINNIINLFTNEFTSGSGKATYKNCIFIEKVNDEYQISKTFKNALRDQAFKQLLEEVLILINDNYERNCRNRYGELNLSLYQKYTYEDACRCLDWAKAEIPLNIGGYKYDRTTQTFPVFINYTKDEDIASTIKYEDRFVSPTRLIAISKSGRRKDSEDMRTIYEAKERGVTILLFIRKNKDDNTSKEFYFLGTMETQGKPKEFIMPGTNKNAVEIDYSLHTPVREDIYDYLTHNIR